jgi:hypothetical protein
LKHADADLPEFIETIPAHAIGNNSFRKRTSELVTLWAARATSLALISVCFIGAILQVLTDPVLLAVVLIGAVLILIEGEIVIMHTLRSKTPILLYRDHIQLMISRSGFMKSSKNRIPYVQIRNVDVIRRDTRQQVDYPSGWVEYHDAPIELGFDISDRKRHETRAKDPQEILKIANLLRAKGVVVIDSGQGPGTIERIR